MKLKPLEDLKKLPLDKLKAIADGRVYGPETACEAGLIDGIKYPEEVYDRARELAGLYDAEIVRGFSQNYFGGSRSKLSVTIRQ